MKGCLTWMSGMGAAVAFRQEVKNLGVWRDYESLTLDVDIIRYWCDLGETKLERIMRFIFSKSGMMKLVIIRVSTATTFSSERSILVSKLMSGDPGTMILGGTLGGMHCGSLYRIWYLKRGLSQESDLV